jgi:hypothetical protein
MGMSTHIVGIVPPDESWKQMKAVYDACLEAGVRAPPEVTDFFGGERPDHSGRTIDLRANCRKYQDSDSEGYEIDIAAIPSHVKTLRFYNSW